MAVVLTNDDVAQAGMLGRTRRSRFSRSRGYGPLNSVLRTRSPRTAVQLAAAGIGVAIVPVSALPLRPSGAVRQLRPTITIEVVDMVAAPSDTLAQQFVAGIRRRGIPTKVRLKT